MILVAALSPCTAVGRETRLLCVEESRGRASRSSCSTVRTSLGLGLWSTSRYRRWEMHTACEIIACPNRVLGKRGKLRRTFYFYRFKAVGYFVTNYEKFGVG